MDQRLICGQVRCEADKVNTMIRRTPMQVYLVEIDDEEKQHIVQEMVPAAVAQHMAEEPDVKQRVFQRGTVDAEQMGGRPAAGVLAQEQHPQ